MTCAFPPTQRFRPVDTGYSHVSVHLPPARPLCVFRILFQGVPVPDPIDGEAIEHGSQWAAETRATKLAREYGTARENLCVTRSWL